MKMKTKVLNRIIAMALTVALATTLIVPVAYAAPSGVIGDQYPINNFVAAQKELLDEPGIEYWPGTRWWMAEGLHTDETLKKDVKTLHDMGIGAVELVCMPEPNVNTNSHIPLNLDTNIWPAGTTAKEVYSWGSEEWIHDTRVVIEECTKYGMGFSMTSGTHWSNANLPESHLVPDDDGAGKSLGYSIQSVDPGATFDGELRRSSKSGTYVVRQDLVRVVAIKVDPSNTGTISTAGAISGTMTYADQAGIDLTSLVRVGGVVVDMDAPPDTAGSLKDSTGAKSYTLNWTAPNDGTYHIYAYWMQGTGQSPTPSASRNFTITYIDKAGMDAFIDYYRTVVFSDPDLVALVKKNGRGEMYMDSLEISSTNGNTGHFWGYTFLDEFKARRGYDLTPYMPYIIRSGNAWTPSYPTRRAGSDSISETKIRTDVYQTMTDMYRENILKPLQKYLHEELNMKLRAEITYGVTYEITTPAQYVDYVETESLEFGSQPDAMRSLAGAAHINGLRLSSETGAVMGGRNYAFGQDLYMQTINSQYAAGVQFSVLHGYSSIEGADTYVQDGTTRVGTEWPGHNGMNANISERWGPRQPAFQHYDDYFSMLGRTQMILMQGIPQVDLAIMRTDYHHHCRLDSIDVLRSNRGFYWQDMTLQNNGFTYDYFAPENLNILDRSGVTLYEDGELIPERVGYQAMIIYQEAMPYESAQLILELAKKGLPVVIVNGVTEYSSISNLYTTKKAASRTLFNDATDAELELVMNEMKALNNVIELDDEKDTFDALLSLGVRPRAQFAEANQSILTNMRKAGDTLYLYTYNYMETFRPYNHAATGASPYPATFSVNLDAAGKPYRIDPWSTDIEEIGEYEIIDGRTVFTVSLEPGATGYFALDLSDAGDSVHVVSTDADKVLLNGRSLSVYATESGTYTTTLSDGSVWEKSIVAPANVSLPEWNLQVEDWTMGDKIYNYEDRGKGYTTTEIYWETNKTMKDAGKTTLLPWREIPAIGPEVSGVGYYSTEFTLPDDWSEFNGAYLQVESFNGNTAAVFVNGIKSKGLDFISRTHDISALLKPGKNEIQITVSSTLLNRVRAMGITTNSYPNDTSPRPYGMVGNVELVTYTVEPILADVEAGVRANADHVGVDSPVSYTVSLDSAKGAGVVTLSFTADSRYLDITSATALNGFTILDPLAWEYIGGQMWKGTVKLYYPGFIQSYSPIDVLRISGVARDLLGNTAVTLTDVTVTGDVNKFAGAMSCVITTAEAVTSIVTKTVFSKYDLNHDGKIDELDLAIVVYYYLANDLEADWEVVKFDIASAKDCDVALNGRVDLADMIEVIANYCDSYVLQP
ncbi:MAG: hypothetical protein FWH55_09320 [Oscillospiraceae bacterium]|nr:hypothetical protein [Oscillospiraceae bacterium]